MSKENLVSIYRIDTNNLFFSDCSNDFKAMIDKIIYRGNLRNEFKKKKDGKDLKSYEILEISNLEDYGFEIDLYHSARSNPSSWNSFLSEVVVDKDSVKFFNRNHDFIVFAHNDDNIFCFTGGIACNLIADVCDDNFARELMIRISNPDKIKQAKSRSLTGSFYAKELYYRSDYNISPTEAFGSIWKDVRASIRDDIRRDPDWKEILGEKGKRDLNCDVKNSFKMRKRVSFNSAIRLINKLQDELKRELSEDEKLNFYFLNTISVVKNKDEKEGLNDFLMQRAFNYLNDEDVQVFDYDFCHKNYANFLEADSYIAKRGRIEIKSWEEIQDAKSVLDDLKDFLNLDNQRMFNLDFSEKIKIISQHEEDPMLDTQGTILDHLHGEISVEGRTYFIIDKEWCFIKDSFLEILSDQFKKYIGEGLCEKIPLNKWSSINEGDYNESHLGLDNFLVGDRIILNGIEFFDLLYIDGDDFYIIQVKNGLGASTRDACSQLRNASKLIEESVKNSDHKKLKEFYRKMKDCGVGYTKDSRFVRQLEAIGTEDDFINKITNGNRFYVLACKYGANATDIENINSNIAKFEILGLKNDIDVLGGSFKIQQILTD